MPINDDQTLVERFQTMMVEEWENTILDLYPALASELIVPDEDHGLSGDPSIRPRNVARAAYAWLDSNVDSDESQSTDVSYLWTRGGFLLSFNARREDIGRVKRQLGFSAWRTAKDWWYTYFHDQGVISFRCDVEYRYGSERITGGARRGIHGKANPQGNQVEQFLLIWKARRKVPTNPRRLRRS